MVRLNVIRPVVTPDREEIGVHVEGQCLHDDEKPLEIANVLSSCESKDVVSGFLLEDDTGDVCHAHHLSAYSAGSAEFGR